MVSGILEALAVIIVAILQTDTVLGCSCGSRDPRVQFCKAQFAILARVVSASDAIYPENIEDIPESLRDHYASHLYVLEVDHDYK